MQNILKKTIKILTVLILLTSVSLSVLTVPAQAAAKLNKSDLKFTGRYKDNMNSVAKVQDASYMASSDISGEKTPKKCIKTKRGITLTSTKQQVFKKYGKVSLKKIKKTSELYYICENNMGDESLAIVEKEKCAIYTYKSGSNTFNLHFFFSKEDKVDCIIISKNC